MRPLAQSHRSFLFLTRVVGLCGAFCSNSWSNSCINESQVANTRRVHFCWKLQINHHSNSYLIIGCLLKITNDEDLSMIKERVCWIDCQTAAKCQYRICLLTLFFCSLQSTTNCVMQKISKVDNSVSCHSLIRWKKRQSYFSLPLQPFSLHVLPV